MSKKQKTKSYQERLSESLTKKPKPATSTKSDTNGNRKNR